MQSEIRYRRDTLLNNSWNSTKVTNQICHLHAKFLGIQYAFNNSNITSPGTQRIMEDRQYNYYWRGMWNDLYKKNVVFFTNNLLKCHFNPDGICDVKVLNCQYETCKHTTRLQFCYHMNNAKYHSTLNSIKCKPELHRIWLF